MLPRVSVEKEAPKINEEVSQHEEEEESMYDPSPYKPLVLFPQMLAKVKKRQVIW
jgi:hypothetical protein